MAARTIHMKYRSLPIGMIHFGPNIHTVATCSHPFLLTPSHQTPFLNSKMVCLNHAFQWYNLSAASSVKNANKHLQLKKTNTIIDT